MKMINQYNNEYIPKRMKIGDCGYDVYLNEDIDFKAGEYQTIDTGVMLEDGDISSNCFVMVVPRSSMGMKYGLRLRNTIGIIDSGYRESIKASLCTDVDVYLNKGTRIMQMIVVPFGLIAAETSPTEIRVSGIGSTGI
jgi:dUTP pyrophosphatase